MNGLDDLLGQDEPVRVEEDKGYGLDSIHITKYAFEKAYAYARLACRRAKRTIECGGYLTAPRDSSDRIVTDTFLARNQDVSEGLFTLNAEDVIKAGREINESGNRVLGWWHSHGDLSTFFSKTDDDGQMTVLNEINSFNYITQKTETPLNNLEMINEDGMTVVFDKRSPERRFKFKTTDGLSLPITELMVEQEKRIGFAYGLVVNNKETREPYAEIATRELCGFCKTSEDKSRPSDVDIFDCEDFVLDDAALMAEIKDRVRMKRRFFKYNRKKLFLPVYQTSGGLFGSWSKDDGNTIAPAVEVPYEGHDEQGGHHGS